jgi:hypothetical protein
MIPPIREEMSWTVSISLVGIIEFTPELPPEQFGVGMAGEEPLLK